MESKLSDMKIGDLKKLYNILEVNGKTKEWFVDELVKFFENPEEENVSEEEEEVEVKQPKTKLSKEERRKEANRKYYLKKKENKGLKGGYKLKGGWLSIKEFKGLLNGSYDKTKKVENFERDHSLSKGKSQVYHDKSTGRTVVAHQGTTGIKDWLNNAVYGLFGKKGYTKTDRYKEAKKVQEEAEKKYGTEKLSTIGHSQGGLQAELLGKNSREILTLNKATRIGSNVKHANQFDISSKGDLVSKMNPLQKKTSRDIVVGRTSYNPIKEHGMDVLDQLSEDQIIGKGYPIPKNEAPDAPFTKSDKILIYRTNDGKNSPMPSYIVEKELYQKKAKAQAQAQPTPTTTTTTPTTTTTGQGKKKKKRVRIQKSFNV